MNLRDLIITIVFLYIFKKIVKMVLIFFPFQVKFHFSYDSINLIYLFILFV